MRILMDPIVRIHSPGSNTLLSCLADCEVLLVGLFLINTALSSLRAKSLEQEQSRILRYGNIYE
jgi:hypothetical protein